MSQNDAIDRYQQIQRVIKIEGLANLTVLLIKAFAGFYTGSYAIMSDALHSLTDLINNIIAWTLAKISSAPPDEDHPYGHQKFETLAVLGLAILLIVLAFEIALGALRREETEVIQDTLSLMLMLGVFIINIGLTIWQHRWAKRLDSDLLHADATHTLGDVATTAVILLGWQLSAHGYPWLDTLCALGVSAFVLYLAYGLMRRALPILVDEAAFAPEELTAVIARVEGVQEVRRVRSRWIGNMKSVDVVIAVDAAMTTADSHEVADAVESVLEAQLQVKDSSIHIEPYTRP